MEYEAFLRLEAEGVNTSNRLEFLLEAIVHLLKLQITSKGVSYESVSGVVEVPQFVHLQTKPPKTPEQLAEEEYANALRLFDGLKSIAKGTK